MKHLFALSFIATLLFSACNKCKEPFYCELPLVAQTYFDMYREGTYWVYVNSDTSKTDSVYVTDYSKLRGENLSRKCLEYDIINLSLISTYLYNQPIAVNISDDGSCEQASVNFDMSTSNSINFDIEKSNPNLFSDQANQLQKIDVFQYLNNPQLLIPDVYIYNNRYWFAPDLGMFQFISYDNVDTFYLDKFYIE